MEKDKFGLRGVFRLQIGEDGPDGKTRIVGDSGYIKNQIVNLGWQDYILASIGGVSGSKQVGRMILGTSNAAPASNGTSLGGETTRSTSINAATVGSFTLRFTTQWTSDLCPGACTLNNAALINNTASGGTILCGNTFSSSQWQTNQAVSATYELQKA